jgi:hypothetical protein
MVFVVNVSSFVHPGDGFLNIFSFSVEDKDGGKLQFFNLSPSVRGHNCHAREGKHYIFVVLIQCVF